MIHVPHALPNFLPAASVVPPLTANPPLAVRDSRWLQLEVCPKFKQGDCNKEDCLLAHPPNQVKIENDFVTVCYDFIKRKECKHSSCKYYHPPQHLVDSVLRKGDENKKLRDHQQQEFSVRNFALSMQPQLWGGAGQPASVHPGTPASLLLTAYGLTPNPAAAQSYSSSPFFHASAQATNPTIGPQSALSMQLSNGQSTGVAEQPSPLEVLCPGQASGLTGGSNYVTAQTAGLPASSALAAYSVNPFGFAMPATNAAAAAVAATANRLQANALKRAAPNNGLESPNSQAWILQSPATKRPNLGQINQTAEASQGVKGVSPGSTSPVTSTAYTLPTSSAALLNGAATARLLLSSAAQGQAGLQAAQVYTSNSAPTLLTSSQPSLTALNSALTQQYLLRPANLASAPGFLGFQSAGGVPSTVPVSLPSQLPDASSLMLTQPTLFNQSAINPVTNVAYINDKGQLLETLPICRDFKAGKCHRNSECRYVHLVDENVEVNNGRLTVCRDAVKGRCMRSPCKYYHVPLFPNIMMNLHT